MIRTPNGGAIGSDVHCDVGGVAAPATLASSTGHVEFSGLPARTELRNGKAIGIGRGTERVHCCYSGSLMMAVTVGRCARKPRNDDFGTEPPDDANEVTNQRFPPPLLEGFAGRLGISELVVGCKELLAAVVFAGREQLLGTDDPQRLEQLVSNEILPAFPARGRQIRGSRSFSPG